MFSINFINLLLLAVIGRQCVIIYIMNVAKAGPMCLYGTCTGNMPEKYSVLTYLVSNVKSKSLL